MITLQSIKFPVQARGMNSAGRDAVGFGHMVADFEIAEKRGEELPIALLYDPGLKSGKPTEYRFDPTSGKIFKRGWKPSKAGYFGFVENGTTSYWELQRSAYREYKNLKASGATEVLPARHSESSLEFPHFSKLHLTDVIEDDIEASCKAASLAIQDCALIDGYLWYSVQEPTLTVGKSNSFWTVGLSRSVWIGPEWRCFSFSLDEMEHALEWIDVLNSNVASRRQRPFEFWLNPDYKVVTNSAFGSAGEFGRVASVPFRKIRKDMGDQFPAEARVACDRLDHINAIPTTDLSEIDVDGMFEAVETLCRLGRQGALRQPGRWDGPAFGIAGELAALHSRKWVEATSRQNFARETPVFRP
jgi:hypothetical protein